MATVTIGRPYFEALLRRAEFHTPAHEFDPNPSLSSNVTISKAEHDYLVQAVREYNSLKSALFRGGLSADTLETLLTNEAGITNEDSSAYDYNSRWDQKFMASHSVPVAMTAQTLLSSDLSPGSADTAVGDGLVQPRPHPNAHNRGHSYHQSESSIDAPDRDDNLCSSSIRRVPIRDQRTVLISNLSDRTTHKDIVGIVRGGRLLDIFLRNDRSATVSFVEGAAEFLAYAKRNDIYLHTKRLEVRWNERQFHVPPHVVNKIAGGATRNIVVRGAGAKFTADQIRDHLDHIHNLVVVDINFKNDDAYISTNSIHNALFARTCMMSRTLYKGLRIDWYPDECAAPLPRPIVKAPTLASSFSVKKAPIGNPFAVLDMDVTDSDSDEEELSYMTSGISISNNWADGVVA